MIILLYIIYLYLTSTITETFTIRDYNVRVYTFNFIYGQSLLMKTFDLYWLIGLC